MNSKSHYRLKINFSIFSWNDGTKSCDSSSALAPPLAVPHLITVKIIVVEDTDLLVEPAAAPHSSCFCASACPAGSQSLTRRGSSLDSILTATSTCTASNERTVSVFTSSPSTQILSKSTLISRKHNDWNSSLHPALSSRSAPSLSSRTLPTWCLWSSLWRLAWKSTLSRWQSPQYVELPVYRNGKFQVHQLTVLQVLCRVEFSQYAVEFLLTARRSSSIWTVKMRLTFSPIFCFYSNFIEKVEAFALEVAAGLFGFRFRKNFFGESSQYRFWFVLGACALLECASAACPCQLLDPGCNLASIVSFLSSSPWCILRTFDPSQLPNENTWLIMTESFLPAATSRASNISRWYPLRSRLKRNSSCHCLLCFCPSIHISTASSWFPQNRCARTCLRFSCSSFTWWSNSLAPDTSNSAAKSN